MNIFISSLTETFTNHDPTTPPSPYIYYKQGGSLRSPPACTCVCLYVLLNLVRYMVWNSLCIPCMDSSPTMSRWSIIQSKTLYHVVVGSLFDCNFRGYKSAWQLRAPFTWFLEHSIIYIYNIFFLFISLFVFYFSPPRSWTRVISLDGCSAEYGRGSGGTSPLGYMAPKPSAKGEGGGPSAACSWASCKHLLWLLSQL